MTGIRYQVEDPVGLITLDRPEARDALTPVMIAEFRRTVEPAAGDPAVVVIAAVNSVAAALLERWAPSLPRLGV